MICTKCKVDTPLEKMGKSKKLKSGYNIYCLECIRAMSKAYREANREICRDAERRYRKNNKEKVNAKKRERYYSKPEELKAKAAQYRQENYERRLEIERNSRVKNKEKYRPAKNARQRIRNKVIQGGTYLILDKELRKIYNSPCFRCGSMKDQSLDHIIPISRGGSHSIGNIMTLCLPCNMSKNVKLLVEWRNQN